MVRRNVSSSEGLVMKFANVLQHADCFVVLDKSRLGMLWVTNYVVHDVPGAVVASPAPWQAPPENTRHGVEVPLV
jgi:hypothetical protein